MVSLSWNKAHCCILMLCKWLWDKIVLIHGVWFYMTDHRTMDTTSRFFFSLERRENTLKYGSLLEWVCFNRVMITWSYLGLPLDFWHLSAPSTAFRLSHMFITLLEWGSKVVTSISYSESKSLHPEVSTPNRESEEPIVLLICVNYLIITVLFYNKDQQAKMSKNYSYSFIF